MGTGNSSNEVPESSNEVRGIILIDTETAVRGSSYDASLHTHTTPKSRVDTMADGQSEPQSAYDAQPTVDAPTARPEHTTPPTSGTDGGPASSDQ
jgi:hypothetical protein